MKTKAPKSINTKVPTPTWPSKKKYITLQTVTRKGEFTLNFLYKISPSNQVIILPSRVHLILDSFPRNKVQQILWLPSYIMHLKIIFFWLFQFQNPNGCSINGWNAFQIQMLKSYCPIFIYHDCWTFDAISSPWNNIRAGQL